MNQTFVLQGSNFAQGVKFSVQTTSRGKCEYFNVAFPIRVGFVGTNGSTGVDVTPSTIKFKEEQNNPANEFVRPLNCVGSCSHTFNKAPMMKIKLIKKRVGFYQVELEDLGSL